MLIIADYMFIPLLTDTVTIMQQTLAEEINAALGIDNEV